MYQWSFFTVLIVIVLDIVCHISFNSKAFMTNHLDIIIKKSGSRSEDKRVHNSKLLLSITERLFPKTPTYKFQNILGNITFDTINSHKYLFTEYSGLGVRAVRWLGNRLAII